MGSSRAPGGGGRGGEDEAEDSRDETCLRPRDDSGDSREAAPASAGDVLLLSLALLLPLLGG